MNTLFSITWVVAEKGKGEKSLVPRDENLKKQKKKCFLRAGWVSQILQHLTPITSRAQKLNRANVQITTLTE